MKIFTVLFVIYLSFINIHINNAEIDCTIYDNDFDAVNMNPFYARRYGGMIASNSSTYIKYINTGPNSIITEFNIANDVKSCKFFISGNIVKFVFNN
ncbi:unnamed protein product [Rotaria sordida]|uniref:Uncharacterized protein n=1 Tax=Rotaria sordida TaxID=392033 RepID=A0A815L6R1_9BILA|nr:unnamed protein product [Rotaria sordida]